MTNVRFALLLMLACGSPVWGHDAKDLEFFESKVRPILIERCVECHGPQKQKGNLRLDSGAAITKGGDSGPTVTAGKPEESYLIEVIGYRGDVKMPPKSKLPENEIATLTEWVKRGAPWPAGDAPVVSTSSQEPMQFTPEQKAFWAFQSVRDVVPPDVKNPDWCRSPLDQFVLATLEKHGLEPAPQADKRTLIRRATFDLIGLPPTPEEIADFLADDSPDAFAHVVDRLLASPRYGERWGRHWLDVARYADSNGLDENLAYANAYRYRDYVIASLNADKPYDVFVHEQLAGDLLPNPVSEAQRQERLVATGFLSLGAKMLAEDDPVKMQMDIIDEQVDTIGRTFLGLTLGCARCHDHKFDPVGTDDYYALAGIFKSTKTMENFTVVARWQERPLASAAELESLQKMKDQLAARQAEIAKVRQEAADIVLAEERRHVLQYFQAVEDARAQAAFLSTLPSLDKDDSPLKQPGAILREAETYDRGNVLKDTTKYGLGIGVLVNKGELPNLAEYDVEVGGTSPAVYLVAIRLAAAASRPVTLSIDGQLLKPDAAKHVTGSWTPESQAWAIETLVKLTPGRHVVQLKCAGPFPHIDKVLLSPTDLTARVAQPGDFVPKPEFVRQWDESLKKQGRPADGATAAAYAAANEAWLALLKSDPQAKSLPDPAQEALRQILYAADGPYAVPPTVETYFPAAVQNRLQAARDEASRLEKEMPKYPEAMIVSDDVAQNLKIHLRGSHLTLGREVPRQFLRVVAGETQTPIPADRSGRRELAEWLTRPEHPLTARVMVNRVWQGHFGEGLVRSPDNFGRLGERPTHPELLDWLARQFISNGWSLKSLHRQVLLSSTWQMSTRHNPAAALADPENRLLWRMNRRRLEVEAIRDSLLYVAGNLEETMGGSQLPTPNRAYVTSTANVNPLTYVGARRSVYLPVVRSALYEVFQAFDFADPSTQNGKRDVTTVAPQALFMMNSEFVSGQSQALAASLLKQTDWDDATRVQHLCERITGHPPTDSQLQRMLGYLESYSQVATPASAGEARLAAWKSLCRTLFAGNEAIYVE